MTGKRITNTIRTLRFLAGEVEAVISATSSAVRGFAVEDTAAAVLRFAGGALGTVLASDVAVSPWCWDFCAGEQPQYPRQAVQSHYLSGTEGSLSLPDLALCQGYGFSEFPVVVCVLDASEAADHVGSAGRPMPISQVAVRTSDGRIAATGKGELVVRSLATMMEYHDRPEETERAFRDGWFHTGDLVDIDADGYVTITGRLKELIISGGLNIYPKEVEDVLLRVEGVKECAVVGVPDEKYGETAAAVLVVDSAAFDPATARALCRESLAGYKRPKHYLVRTDPLPRNANAKMLKRDLVPWATDVLVGQAPSDQAKATTWTP